MTDTTHPDATRAPMTDNPARSTDMTDATNPGATRAPVNDTRSLHLAWLMAQRMAGALVGGLLVVLGTVMLVLPGPGLLVILLGLGVLSANFAWARRARKRLQAASTRAASRGRTGRRR